MRYVYEQGLRASSSLRSHERNRVALRAGGKRRGLLSQLLMDVINDAIPEVFVDIITDVISDVIFEVGGGSASWGVPLTMGTRVIVDTHRGYDR